MIRKLGLSVLLTSLAACSFHASMQAGSRSAAEPEPGLAAAPTPSAPEQPAAQPQELAAREQPPAATEQPLSQAPAPEAQPPARDHDRGHGNDADHRDEDNP